MTNQVRGSRDEDGDRPLEGPLAELRGTYNVPPKPPLDEMWERIERESFEARAGTRRRRVGGRGAQGFGAQSGFDARSAVRSVRGFWWLGMVAALVVGVGIGRLTTSTPQVVTAADAPRTADTGDTAASYDQTTARYLGQTAALLIALPAEARAAQPDRRFVARAAELLTTTRLLLDSPAAADPKVRALLEDVELVLAQIAHLDSDRGRVEYELIAQALEQRDLLPRLQSAVAGGAGADN